MQNKSFSQFNTKLWRTILLCLVFVLSLYLTLDFTFAWFYEQSGTNKVLIVGNVDLTVNINDNFVDNAIAPNKIYSNMSTTIKLSDRHTTNSALIRAKFKASSNMLSLYGIDESVWIKNVESGETYYYYLGLLTSQEITFNTGYQTSGTFTNANVGANISYTLTVYGLQSQYKAYKEEWPNAPASWIAWADSNL